MANPFTDQQVQDSLDRIASPEKRVVAPDGRAVEFRSTDEEIKAYFRANAAGLGRSFGGIGGRFAPANFRPRRSPE